MLTATIHNIVFPSKSSLLFFDTYLEPILNIIYFWRKQILSFERWSNCFYHVYWNASLVVQIKNDKHEIDHELNWCLEVMYATIYANKF